MRGKSTQEGTAYQLGTLIRLEREFKRGGLLLVLISHDVLSGCLSLSGSFGGLGTSGLRLSTATPHWTAWRGQADMERDRVSGLATARDSALLHLQVGPVNTQTAGRRGASWMTR
jgi:hypothetical protein